MRGIASLFIALGLVGCAGGDSLQTSADAGGSSPDADTSNVDAAAGDDAGDGASDDALADGGVASRCTQTPKNVTCTYKQLTLDVSTTSHRTVLYQVPLGTPPAQGWPVVLFFQGSFLGGPLIFSGDVNVLFDPYAETLTVKRLLDHGYAVIAPEAQVSGTTYWNTNIPPWDVDWKDSPDAALMTKLFSAFADGTFGPLDATTLFATGISSGGYMTSRMAVSYPGKFKALAVNSGSYATCGGPACVIPNPLPSDHPPTLFCHGQLDPAVPIASMQAYDMQLASQGIATKTVVDPTALHTWIDAAPDAILAWFEAHH
jgi:poly(3-hydroxybutyrate) depolymerase